MNRLLHSVTAYVLLIVVTAVSFCGAAIANDDEQGESIEDGAPVTHVSEQIGAMNDDLDTAR